MLHTGTGPSGVRRFMHGIEVPTISETSLKKREREVGPVLEKLARESCNKGLEEEKQLAYDLVASFDAGWQSRGSGRSYNSKSGHAVLIGGKSGKIISYGSRIRNCKQCSVNPKKKHDCRKNWDGSAKSMEGDLAVELVTKVSDSNQQIKV